MAGLVETPLLKASPVLRFTCVLLLVFAGALMELGATRAEAQTPCRMTWRQTPRIAPANSVLSCEIGVRRRLILTRSSGVERVFRRQRFKRLAHDAAAYTEALARFARLRRRCRRISPLVFNPNRFIPSFSCYGQAISPTATPTPIPFEVSDEIEFSRAEVDFGAVGVGEHRLVSVIVRSASAQKQIRSLVFQGDSALTLLAPHEVIQHGGVPCTGSVRPFCALMLSLDASQVGALQGEIRLLVGQAGTSGEELHVLPVHAVVQDLPTRHLDRYHKVDLGALASAAGETVQQRALRMFDALRPAFWAPHDRNLFDDYQQSGPSVWSSNWANSAFDLSGVAWDVATAGTAITRCHVVFAAHFQRNSFQSIRFHRKNGQRFRTEVTRIRKLEGVDIGVGRLDPCLPSDWTIYPVLTLPTLEPGQSDPRFRGLPILATHHGRYVSLWETSGFAGAGWFMTRSPRYPEMYRDAITGDSGHPLFVVDDGELVLVMTFSTNGGGPGYTSAHVDSLLMEAIHDLGPR